MSTAEETTELEPIADTYISSSDPDDTFGSKTYIRIGDAQVTNNYVRVGYLMFDFSEIEGSIQEATLKLYLKWSWEVVTVPVNLL